MGGPEVVILIVLGLIILVPMLMKAAGRAGERPVGRATRTSTSVRQLPPKPSELPGVRAAISRGDWPRAVDLYHEVSGLPRAQAESAVMATVEPGPNQTGTGRTGTDPAGTGRAGGPPTGDDGWPELPDRNRRGD